MTQAVRSTFQDKYFDVRSIADGYGLKTYDTAIPQDWSNHVEEITGIYPWSLGFVWCYDQSKVWGAPFPLTQAANVLLHVYDKLTGQVSPHKRVL